MWLFKDDIHDTLSSHSLAAIGITSYLGGCWDCSFGMVTFIHNSISSHSRSRHCTSAINRTNVNLY